MDIYAQIADAIKQIGGKKSALLFPAEVKSVEGKICTIRVGKDLDLSDVRLCAIVDDNIDQLLITPKVGSKVMVADLSNGEFRDLMVIKFSETDSIEIHGGKLGGLIKIEELTNKLNDLIDAFNNHTHGGVIVGVSGGSGAPAVGATGNTAKISTAHAKLDKSDYEDTKVTH